MNWYHRGADASARAAPTEKQIKFLHFRRIRLLELIPKEDADLAQIMGIEKWLAGLSRSEASGFIDKIKKFDEKNQAKKDKATAMHGESVYKDEDFMDECPF